MAELLKIRSKVEELSLIVSKAHEPVRILKEESDLVDDRPPALDRHLDEPSKYLSLGGEVGHKRAFEEVVAKTCCALIDRGLEDDGRDLRDAAVGQPTMQSRVKFD